jgi:hydrogenase expression/formation protein HypC
MCLAVPAKVLNLEGNYGTLDFGGLQSRVNLSLLPEVKPGDYCIVHAGFAIQILDQAEARETLALFQEISNLEHEVSD